MIGGEYSGGRSGPPSLPRDNDGDDADAGHNADETDLDSLVLAPKRRQSWTMSDSN